MLTKFSVSNFKNFDSKIELDLSHPEDYEFNSDLIVGGNITKGLIYGTNASGKTNFCLALFDITIHLTDKQTIRDSLHVSSPYLNIYSPDKVAEFEYEFVFDNKKVKYRYSKQDYNLLLNEYLYIDGREIVFYDFTTNTGHTCLKSTEKLNLDYTENNISGDNNISIIKYIKNNSHLPTDDSDCKVFLAFVDFVERMLFFRYNTGYQGFASGEENPIQRIVNKHRTSEFQDFLHEFGLDYKLRESNQSGSNNIYCEGKDGIMVPFVDMASRGTYSLMLLYNWYNSLDKTSFVMIDEFDAFYHYELSESVVKKLKEFSSSQIFLTTHNTDLLDNELLRPDCYFILQNQKINSLNNLTAKEIRFPHNLQKMYKAGFFNERK